MVDPHIGTAMGAGNPAPVKPPKLPQNYDTTPVSPMALAEARAGVPRYAQRLSGGLNVLVWLNALGLLFGLAGLGWVYTALPGWLRQTNWLENPGDLQTYQQYAPLVLALLGLLSVLAVACNIWCFVVARRSVEATMRQTTAPSQQNAAATVQGVRTLLPWLTLGQWYPVIMFVLVTLPTLVAVSWALKSGGSDLGSSDFGAMFLQTGISTVFQTVPYIVIPWLLIAAVKRWLQAIATRTVQPQFPVRPFASSLNNWLVFLMVIYGFYAVSALLGGLMGGGVALLALQSADVKPADMQWVKPVMAAITTLLLGMGLLYALQGILVMWFRAFANAVATVLDSTLPAPQGVALDTETNW